MNKPYEPEKYEHSDRPTARPLQAINEIEQRVKNYSRTDKEFFESLQVYKPICYTGMGSPVLLYNKGCSMSFGCILILNAIFLLVYLVVLVHAGEGLRPSSPQKISTLKWVNFIGLALIDISYLLTQFLNPGIRNLSTVPEDEYSREGRFYCSLCNGDRTGRMQHCRDCDVCIEKLDHHCGFFGKCIGGCQLYAFYAFFLCVLAGFLGLIYTLLSSIG